MPYQPAIQHPSGSACSRQGGTTGLRGDRGGQHERARLGGMVEVDSHYQGELFVGGPQHASGGGDRPRDDRGADRERWHIVEVEVGEDAGFVPPGTGRLVHVPCRGDASADRAAGGVGEVADEPAGEADTAGGGTSAVPGRRPAVAAQQDRPHPRPRHRCGCVDGGFEAWGCERFGVGVDRRQGRVVGVGGYFVEQQPEHSDLPDGGLGDLAVEDGVLACEQPHLPVRTHLRGVFGHRHSSRVLRRVRRREPAYRCSCKAVGDSQRRHADAGAGVDEPHECRRSASDAAATGRDTHRPVAFAECVVRCGRRPGWLGCCWLRRHAGEVMWSRQGPYRATVSF